MEKRMDRHNQSSQDNQFSLSEENSSSSPTLLQEKRLSRRIIWLTLFLGIAVGICLTLFGELCYVLAGYIPHAFSPTSPIIYRLLAPFMVASMGVASLIHGKLQRLRQQHPIFRPGRFDPLGNSSAGPSSLSYGLFFILCGGFGALAVLLPGSFLGNLILLLWVTGGIISLIATWLVPFLKRRRRAQQ